MPIKKKVWQLFLVFHASQAHRTSYCAPGQFKGAFVFVKTLVHFWATHGHKAKLANHHDPATKLLRRTSVRDPCWPGRHCSSIGKRWERPSWTCHSFCESRWGQHQTGHCHNHRVLSGKSLCVIFHGELGGQRCQDPHGRHGFWEHALSTVDGIWIGVSCVCKKVIGFQW